METITSKYNDVEYKVADFDDFLAIIEVAEKLGMKLYDAFFNTLEPIYKVDLADDFAESVSIELDKCDYLHPGYIERNQKYIRWFREHLPKSESTVRQMVEWEMDDSKKYDDDYDDYGDYEDYTAFADCNDNYDNCDDEYKGYDYGYGIDMDQIIRNKFNCPILSGGQMDNYLNRWETDWNTGMAIVKSEKPADIILPIAKSYIKPYKSNPTTKMVCIGLTMGDTSFGYIYFDEYRILQSTENDKTAYIKMEPDKPYTVSIITKNRKRNNVKMTGSDIVKANKRYMATKRS